MSEVLCYLFISCWQRCLRVLLKKDGTSCQPDCLSVSPFPEAEEREREGAGSGRQSAKQTRFFAIKKLSAAILVSLLVGYELMLYIRKNLTTCNKSVLALLAPSCQQVVPNLLKTCNTLDENIRLVTRLF